MISAVNHRLPPRPDSSLYHLAAVQGLGAIRWLTQSIIAASGPQLTQRLPHCLRDPKNETMLEKFFETNESILEPVSKFTYTKVSR